MNKSSFSAPRAAFFARPFCGLGLTVLGGACRGLRRSACDWIPEGVNDLRCCRGAVLPVELVYSTVGLLDDAEAVFRALAQKSPQGCSRAGAVERRRWRAFADRGRLARAARTGRAPLRPGRAPYGFVQHCASEGAGRRPVWGADADWRDRGTFRAGTSSGSPVGLGGRQEASSPRR